MLPGYKFVGFGAMDVSKPYEFIEFGAMDVTKPCEFIGKLICGPPLHGNQRKRQKMKDPGPQIRSTT